MKEKKSIQGGDPAGHGEVLKWEEPSIVNQKYGLLCSKKFCDQLKEQVADHSTKGVIVQKSIMKQKKGEISKLTNTTTNPWMQDTRSLNNSGDLEWSIKNRCHPLRSISRWFRLLLSSYTWELFIIWFAVEPKKSYHTIWNYEPIDKPNCYG